MRFGSVAFFKVLIKTVLCIVFFLPLVLCVVFAVMLWHSNAKLDDMQHENSVLASKIAYLSGESEPSVEGFYNIYSSSGLTDEALIAYINNKNGTDTSESKESAGVIEHDSHQTTSAADSTQPLPQTEEPEPAAPTEEPEETEAAETVQSANPYEQLYEDMTVRVPASYVREEGIVYLTFDDGPSANTHSVLYYLDQYDIKATFFVVPQRTEECYALMKQIVDSGHSIGVHSATHDYETIYGSVEKFLTDFHEAWTMIYEATGVKTEIFRFPGGSKNDYNGPTRDAIIEEMTRRGFRFYDWNVDSNDAGDATWTEMYTSVPADIAQNFRSVVLFHDSAQRANTVYVLEDIIRQLIKDGYKFDKINNNTQPVQFIGPFA